MTTRKRKQRKFNEDSGEYRVKKIIKAKRNKNGAVTYYQIHWDTDELTWEPEHRLSACTKLVAKFSRFLNPYNNTAKNLLNEWFAKTAIDFSTTEHPHILILDGPTLSTSKHLIEAGISSSQIVIPNDAEYDMLHKTRDSYPELSGLHLFDSSLYDLLTTRSHIFRELLISCLWLDYNITWKGDERNISKPRVDVMELFQRFSYMLAPVLLFGITVCHRNWKPKRGTKKSCVDYTFDQVKQIAKKFGYVYTKRLKVISYGRVTTIFMRLS